MLTKKVLVAVLAATIASTSFAFSLDSVKKVAVGARTACTFAGETATEEGLAKEQKKLQANTSAVSKKILAAQSKLAEALDLKQVAANVEAQMKTIKKGNISSDNLKKVTTVSADADKAIEEQMKKIDSLDASQKKMLGESLAEYADAALGTAQISAKTVQAGAATACIVSQNPTNAVRIKKQLGFLASSAKTLPGFSKDLITTGFSYVKLAKDFGIDTSAATEKLKSASKIKFEK